MVYFASHEKWQVGSKPRNVKRVAKDGWILFKKSDRRICNALCVCCIVDLFACGLVLGRSVPFTVNCFGVHLVETGSPKDDFRFRGLGFNSERERAFRSAMFFGKWFVGLWGYGLGGCCFADVWF